MTTKEALEIVLDEADDTQPEQYTCPDCSHPKCVSRRSYALNVRAASKIIRAANLGERDLVLEEAAQVAENFHADLPAWTWPEVITQRIRALKGGGSK